MTGSMWTEENLMMLSSHHVWLASTQAEYGRLVVYTKGKEMSTKKGDGSLRLIHIEEIPEQIKAKGDQEDDCLGSSSKHDYSYPVASPSEVL